MKPHGEREAALAQLVTHAHKEAFGRGPMQVHAHLLDGLAVVHLRQGLTHAEQHLARTDPLAARDFRRRALEAQAPAMLVAARDCLGVPVRAVLADVACALDETTVTFFLAPPPPVGG